MARVEHGHVVIFGAGGAVGAATTNALKDHYTLRCTDVVPIEQIVTEQRRQNKSAPLPELLAAPHDRRVVDVTDYDQVLDACQGMDAAINLTVLRRHPEKTFMVNTVGAFNIARAVAETGVKRLIHTGPFHTMLRHHADYFYDFELVDDVPLHPGNEIYPMTKYLGAQITRVFAERRGLDVLSFLFCAFRSRRIGPEERGRGVLPFTVSWEDAGESFLHGLRADPMPTPYEVFFICSDTPDRKHRVDKARRLLGWTAQDTWEELYRRVDS